MTKKLIAAIALATLSLTAISHAAFAKTETEYVYSDASVFPLFGKITPETAEQYSRLPLSMKETVRPAVWKLSRCSSGLFVRFSSDAGNFNFRWKSVQKRNMLNMTSIGASGLALYVYDKGQWVYLSSPKYKTKEGVNSAVVKASRLVGQTREYMLYLSLYNGVSDLQIGVPKGKTAAAPTIDSPRAEKPVIIYGTSILQGASASQPGMCGTAQLSRRIDRVVVNLGFSGNCLLEDPLAEYMASYPDPGMYIIDNWNGKADVGERGLEKCIRILLKAHPDTPVLIADRAIKPGALFDDGLYHEFVSKKEVADKVVAKLRKEGVKNIYHVTPDVRGCENSGTADGTHFTDEAFTKWVDAIMPVVKKVYRKY